MMRDNNKTALNRALRRISDTVCYTVDSSNLKVPFDGHANIRDLRDVLYGTLQAAPLALSLCLRLAVRSE